MTAIYYKPYKTTEYIQLIFITDVGKSSFRKFADWLIVQSSNNNLFQAIAHNASRFDNYFFLAILTQQETLLSKINFDTPSTERTPSQSLRRPSNLPLRVTCVALSELIRLTPASMNSNKSQSRTGLDPPTHSLCISSGDPPGHGAEVYPGSSH